MKFKEFFESAKHADVDSVGKTKAYTWRGYSLHIYNTGIQINVIDDDDYAEIAIVDSGDEYHVYKSSRRGYIDYDSYTAFNADDDVYASLESMFGDIYASRFTEAIALVENMVA